MQSRNRKDGVRTAEAAGELDMPLRDFYAQEKIDEAIEQDALSGSTENICRLINQAFKMGMKIPIDDDEIADEAVGELDE